MKKFNITVNGQAYEVEVEEMGGSAAPVAAAPKAAPVAAAAPAPKAAPAPAPKAAAAPVPAGAATVSAPMRHMCAMLQMQRRAEIAPDVGHA